MLSIQQLSKLLGKRYPARYEILDGRRSAKLARAIGDLKYLSGNKIHPSYLLLLDRNLGMILSDLGLDLSKMYQLEQELEYFRELNPGELITTTSCIKELQLENGRVSMVVESTHFGSDQQLIAISRTKYAIEIQRKQLKPSSDSIR